jgi:hypothetical protein
MREIKFRGYDEENEQWVCGGYYRGVADLISPRIASYIIQDGTLFYIHREKSIGQYAGLLDKNGVEICEGDIVENRYRHSIEFVTGCFCLKDKSGSTSPLFESHNNMGVIGNIYENQELLEAE